MDIAPVRSKTIGGPAGFSGSDAAVGRGAPYTRVHERPGPRWAPCPRPDRGRGQHTGPAVDLPHLRRPLERARLEPALPAEPGQRADRPVDRVRSADPVRLLLR